MLDRVNEYILSSRKKTINKPNDKVPYPFNAPSTVFYTDFFYWDLYFINKGLLFSKMDKQVENNLRNMMHFVNTLGYVPNSTSKYLIDRTQPPVFPLAVYDLYRYRKDKKVIETFIDAIIKEHDFFQNRRMTEIGLNAFLCDDATNDYDKIMAHYVGLHDRVNEESDDKEKQYKIGRNIIAIAESGLDFNARFKTKDCNIAAEEFAQIDLNSWLYADEIVISKMLLAINRKEESERFLQLANKRKELMDKYFLDKKTGLYKDYHLKTGKHSEIITAANIYPYALGISKDKEGCLKIFKDLELEYGVSTAKYRGKDDFYYQWDYPVMWGETTYLTYVALKNVGADLEASRVREKYLNVIRKQFELTGKLWEKYDARDGSIMNIEYDAPPFFGWTASTYQLFYQPDNELIKIL